MYLHALTIQFLLSAFEDTHVIILRVFVIRVAVNYGIIDGHLPLYQIMLNAFPRWLNHLSSHQLCRRVSLAPCSCQHNIFRLQFRLLWCIQRYFIMVLIYICLIINKVEHLFVCSSTLWISSCGLLVQLFSSHL